MSVPQDLVTLTIAGTAVRATPVGIDSYVIPDATKYFGLDAHEINDLISDLQYQHRDDQAMMYRGNQLRRSKLFSYDPALKERGMFPIYNYPGRTWRTARMYQTWDEVPVLQILAKCLKTQLKIDGEKIGKDINHCIGTLYEDGEDCIGPHNDKVDDLSGPIYTFSFGAERELHLHNNDNKDLKHPDQVIVMQPGSLFVLGPETNHAMKHSIPTSDLHHTLPRTINTGARTSIIFRTVTRLLSQERVDKHVAAAERSKLTRDAVKQRRNAAKQE